MCCVCCVHPCEASFWLCAPATFKLDSKWHRTHKPLAHVHARSKHQQSTHSVCTSASNVFASQALSKTNDTARPEGKSASASSGDSTRQAARPPSSSTTRRKSESAELCVYACAARMCTLVAQQGSSAATAPGSLIPKPTYLICLTHMSLEWCSLIPVKLAPRILSRISRSITAAALPRRQSRISVPHGTRAAAAKHACTARRPSGTSRMKGQKDCRKRRRYGSTRLIASSDAASSPPSARPDRLISASRSYIRQSKSACVSSAGSSARQPALRY